MLGNPPSFFQGYLSSEDKRFYQEPKGGKMLSALPAPHPRHTLRLRFGRWGGWLGGLGSLPFPHPERVTRQGPVSGQFSTALWKPREGEA